MLYCNVAQSQIATGICDMRPYLLTHMNTRSASIGGIARAEVAPRMPAHFQHPLTGFAAA
jgi:hypothetical protein